MKTVASKARLKMPLDYRRLRLVSLVAMTLGQVSSLLLLCSSVYDLIGAGNPYTPFIFLLKIFKTFGQITIPLLIISSMSIMLRGGTPVYRILITSLLCAVLLDLAYMISYAIAWGLLLNILKSDMSAAITKIIEIAGSPGFSKVLGNVLQDEETGEIADKLISAVKQLPEEFLSKLTPQSIADFISRYFSLDALNNIFNFYKAQGVKLFARFANKNIFIDVFLCTSVYWFIHYKPKHFKGGALMIFRMGAAIPIAYILIGLIINSAVQSGWIEPTLETVIFTPTHAPGNYAVFIGIIIFRKYQEMECIGNGGTAKDIENYLVSPRGAQQMAVFLAIWMVVISLADQCLSGIAFLKNWGVGNCKWMMLGAPFVLLFSYRKQPRYKWIDSLYIPAYYLLHLGLLVLVAVYIGGSAVDAAMKLLG